jgi:hypothetical protein
MDEERGDETGGQWPTLCTLRTTNRLERGKCYELTFMRPARPERGRQVQRRKSSLDGKADSGHVMTQSGNVLMQQYIDARPGSCISASVQ